MHSPSDRRSDVALNATAGGIVSRRRVLQFGAGVLAFSGGRALAATETLTFDDLYASSGVLGLKFSTRLLSLMGKPVAIQGFMAPPLKAESNFFVLTREPVALCPFCSSDADWPSDIVVVYLRKAASPTKYSDPLAVTGTLEVGSWTDPENGFVSQVRLVDAAFRTV